MQVFTLCYNNYAYEDFALRGIYTEEAMKQKRIEFAKRQKKFNEDLLKVHFSTLEAKQKEKKELINKMEGDLLLMQKTAKESGNKEIEKTCKYTRNELRKKIDIIQATVWNLEEEIKQEQETNLDKLADKYMRNNHLFFEEHSIIETVREGDCYTDECLCSD